MGVRACSDDEPFAAARELGHARAARTTAQVKHSGRRTSISVAWWREGAATGVAGDSTAGILLTSEHFSYRCNAYGERLARSAEARARLQNCKFRGGWSGHPRSSQTTLLQACQLSPDSPIQLEEHIPRDRER